MTSTTKELWEGLFQTYDDMFEDKRIHNVATSSEAHQSPHPYVVSKR